MSTLGREAETSKFHFGGCCGASGKLASRSTFRALLGSSWPGGHNFTPDNVFFGFLDGRQVGGWKTVKYEHSGLAPSWRL